MSLRIAGGGVEEGAVRVSVGCQLLGQQLLLGGCQSRRPVDALRLDRTVRLIRAKKIHQIFNAYFGDIDLIFTV